MWGRPVADIDTTALRDALALGHMSASNFVALCNALDELRASAADLSAQVETLKVAAAWWQAEVVEQSGRAMTAEASLTAVTAERDRQLQRAEDIHADRMRWAERYADWRARAEAAEASAETAERERDEARSYAQAVSDTNRDNCDRAEAAEAEIARWPHDWETRFPCDGFCSDAPEEDCSRHGRTPAELWRIVTEVQAQRDAAQARVVELTAEVERITGHAAEYFRKLAAVRDLAEFKPVNTSAFHYSYYDGWRAAMARVLDELPAVGAALNGATDD